MLRPLLVFGLLSAATSAFAGPEPLTGDALKALSGAMVELDTPLGTKLPIRFGSDGLVSAEAGELAPILGSAKDRGRWWVENDKLCSKWFRWFDAEVRCITVAKDGTRLYWRKDDGETGTATLIEEPEAKPAPAVIAAAAAPVVKTAPAAQAPKSDPEPEIAKVEAADVVVPAPVRKPERTPQTSPLVTVADATGSAAEAPDTDSMMRFGGEGLLAASARAAEPSRPPAEDVQTSALGAPAVTETDQSLNDKLSPLRRDPRSSPAALVSKPKQKAMEPHASRASVAAPPPALRKKAPVPPAARPVVYYRVYGVHRSDVLNVRRGPSEEFEQIAAIPPKGRRVEITGRCQEEWCPIRYGRVRGWVNSFYLVAEGTVGSSSQVYFAQP